jgi:hypothetical protein
MDFTARLSRVNSRPSRTDDSKFVTTVALECHDLREVGILSAMLGQSVEIRLESVPTPMSPMERAINDTLARTPVVGGVQADPEANARVEESDDFAPEAEEKTNGTITSIEHVAPAGASRRGRRPAS